MIRKLWLYPPLAFARLGPSATPCPSFLWGPNDVRTRGTGKTTIQPALTLHVADDGALTASLPTEVAFKDAAGFRPVCPFFELHGEWIGNGQTTAGPITSRVLGDFGLAPRDLVWRIEVANLKAFHYTLALDDRVEARVELRGDVTSRQPLRGTSPGNALQPLVPASESVPLGSVQLTRPTEQFPGFRLRFTPAAGRVYGPTDLPQRSNVFVLPADRLILNPTAPWCRFRISDDVRTNPGGLFASDDSGVSLGLVDDVCDGVVRCSLPGFPPAVARVVVGPTNFAPDRRPLVSLADGLADRVRRVDVREPSYVEDLGATTLEVQDLMERILETMELMNVDFQNERARRENRSIARDAGLPEEVAADRAFPGWEPLSHRPLPLTESGRQRHRRFVSLEVFEDILRERPELIKLMIREPMTGERYYDRLMPFGMRGSDRYPMHLTRRQYDLLVAWVRRLRRDAEGGT
jgi:hypothetical protein